MNTFNETLFFGIESTLCGDQSLAQTQNLIFVTNILFLFFFYKILTQP